MEKLNRRLSAFLCATLMLYTPLLESAAHAQEPCVPLGPNIANGQDLNAMLRNMYSSLFGTTETWMNTYDPSVQDNNYGNLELLYPMDATTIALGIYAGADRHAHTYTVELLQIQERNLRQAVAGSQEQLALIQSIQASGLPADQIQQLVNQIQISAISEEQYQQGTGATSMRVWDVIANLSTPLASFLVAGQVMSIVTDGTLHTYLMIFLHLDYCALGSAAVQGGTPLQGSGFLPAQTIIFPPQLDTDCSWCRQQHALRMQIINQVYNLEIEEADEEYDGEVAAAEQEMQQAIEAAENKLSSDLLAAGAVFGAATITCMGGAIAAGPFVVLAFATCMAAAIGLYAYQVKSAYDTHKDSVTAARQRFGNRVDAAIRQRNQRKAAARRSYDADRAASALQLADCLRAFRCYCSDPETGAEMSCLEEALRQRN